MSIRKLRKSWWVDFRFNHVRYRKRSPLNTAAGAKLYELTLRGRLARGEPPIPPPPEATATFAEFADEWFTTYVQANNKPSEQLTKRGILRRRLVPRFGDRRLDRITSEEVERFKAELVADGLCAKTVNNILGTLRTCLSSAVEWGRISRAPALRPLKVPPRRTDYLSEAEAERLRGYSVEHAEPYGMVLAALDTGLRLGELRALRWEDVDFDASLITVSRAIAGSNESSTKNNRIRTIPFTDELGYALRSRARSSDRVFPGHDDRAISEDSASNLLARACTAAGVRRVAWHRLRHTFATRLVRRGQSLRAVQALLGHSTVTMTERYAHVAPNHLREAIDSLGTVVDSEKWTTRGQRVHSDAEDASAPHIADAANLSKKTPSEGVSGPG